MPPIIFKHYEDPPGRAITVYLFWRKNTGSTGLLLLCSQFLRIQTLPAFNLFLLPLNVATLTGEDPEELRY